MRRPVQFDNNATFRTIKVDNIRTNAELPTEFETVKLAAFQKLPENSLCLSSLISKLSAEFLPRTNVVDSTFSFLFHAPN
jgi:hypothetical protein